VIFSVKPFEIHDGDGIRTTVFFKGCSLRCRWCHNPESFMPQKEIAFNAARCVHCMRCVPLCAANTATGHTHVFDRTACDVCGKCVSVCTEKAFEVFGESPSVEELADELLRDEIFFKGSGGGVTFSGGEPLLQADLCVALARRLKTHGIHIAVDTAAHVPTAAIAAIAPYTDQFLVDIKAMDEQVHIACTGVSNKGILDNIRYMDTLSIPMEIRYPYVPTMNDGEWKAVAQFVNELHNVTVLRVLPYHNYAATKYQALGYEYSLLDVPIPTAAEIQRVVVEMQHMGVHACSF